MLSPLFYFLNVLRNTPTSRKPSVDFFPNLFEYKNSNPPFNPS
jgi:hypothetical protein